MERSPTEVADIVCNEAGQPLSGPSVIIKSTGKGTITNAKSEFVLSAAGQRHGVQPDTRTGKMFYMGIGLNFQIRKQVFSEAANDSISQLPLLRKFLKNIGLKDTSRA